MTKFFALILSVISLSFFACGGIKPGSAKKGKKLYESFFVGEEGVQYFIKPIGFRNSAKETAFLDLTFRYKDTIQQSAALKGSLFTNELIKEADSLVWQSGAEQVVIRDIDVIFTEREKDQFHNRFSASMDGRALPRIFTTPDWKLHVYDEGKSVQFSPSPKGSKAIRTLEASVFQLL
ncbi:MAG: hypothetical protein AAF206_13740 [Bacteroidota bacterium]